LINDHPTSEIIAILGHEIGHWKLWHVVLQMGYMFVNIFFMFYLFSLVITRKDILTSFGYKEQYNTLAFLLFLELYNPISAISNLI